MENRGCTAPVVEHFSELARTIADLAGATCSDGTGAIETAHLAEAIQYRPRRQM